MSVEIVPQQYALSITRRGDGYVVINVCTIKPVCKELHVELEKVSFMNR